MASFAYLIVDRGGNIVPGTTVPYQRKKDAIKAADTIGGVSVYETFWIFDVNFQGPRREAEGGEIIYHAPDKPTKPSLATHPLGAPGSPKAVANGCKCPAGDNRQGLGAGDGNYWVEKDCPIHGDSASKTGTS